MPAPPKAPGAEPVRVAQVLGRLISGVAQQAIMLADQLGGEGYEVAIVRGAAGRGEERLEAAMEGLAASRGVRLLRVRGMRGRAPRPADALALVRMRRTLAELRPQVLHTHASKGGAVGRLAALSSRRRPQVIIHTFHGHLLDRHFPRPLSVAYRAVERALARRSTLLVAIAPEIKQDLVRLGIAPAERIEVVPIGLDLGRFAPASPAERAAARSELGLPAGGPVLTLAGRLARVKRVDRFLGVAAELAARRPELAFLVAGSGELERELRASPQAERLGARLVWAGYRDDVETVYRASDVLASTSEIEGTPITLIEGQAAGVPVVATDIVGTRTAVADGLSGLLVAEADEAAFAAAVERLLDHPDLASRLARAGRERALAEFSLERLRERWDALYRRLLDESA